jgi:hypothetical protein
MSDITKKPRPNQGKDISPHQTDERVYQFYNPIYAKIAGNIPAGLVLSKIMYTKRECLKDEILYTDKELTKDLAMGLHQLRNAKDCLINLGIITVKRVGLPAKTSYVIHQNRLVELVSNVMEKKNVRNEEKY